MSPERLTSIYTQKIEFIIHSPNQKDTLVKMQRNLNVEPDGRSADIRAGIIFVGKRDANGGVWRYGIFSDDFGRYGYSGVIGDGALQLENGEDRGISLNRSLLNYIDKLLAPTEE